MAARRGRSPCFAAPSTSPATPARCRNTGAVSRRVVVDVAVVGDRASRAEAAGELPALAESPIQGEIDAVIHLRLPAVIRRLGDEIVNPAEERGLDVVQTANLISAATRQTAILRRRDAVRVVAGGGNGLVVRREIAAIPACGNIRRSAPDPASARAGT